MISVERAVALLILEAAVIQLMVGVASLSQHSYVILSLGLFALIVCLSVVWCAARAKSPSAQEMSHPGGS